MKPGKVVALLGRNGSGKSTLINAITNHPNLKVEGEVVLEEPVFVGFQKPVEVPEIRYIDLLLFLDRKYGQNSDTVDMFCLNYTEQITALQLTRDMLERPLNTDVSGGENKRIEILQMLVMKPRTLLLDEIDTGLDLDALILIGKMLGDYIRVHKPTVIIVTHNINFLKHFPIDWVIVLRDGKSFIEGKKPLLDKIEKLGFNALT